MTLVTKLVEVDQSRPKYTQQSTRGRKRKSLEPGTVYEVRPEDDSCFVVVVDDDHSTVILEWSSTHLTIES